MRSIILIPGSLSAVMMPTAPAKTSAGDARYASQDPFIPAINIVHTISTPICIKSAFFLRRVQLSLISLGEDSKEIEVAALV